MNAVSRSRPPRTKGNSNLTFFPNFGILGSPVSVDRLTRSAVVVPVCWLTCPPERMEKHQSVTAVALSADR